MPKYQFVQPIYYYYEVEANSLEEAYEKTSELEAGDCYDEVIGGWEDCTPELEERLNA